MQAPQIPLDEPRRINSLHSLDILDSAAEERFDRLTRLARKLFHAPTAMVSLIDTNRQWFKSCIGLDATETPRDISFCGHAILQNDVFVIEDALQDARFADNPLVVGEPKIRFYAGCPLVLANGSKVGTLCIIDRTPREFGQEDRDLLRDLAKMAEQELAAIQLATNDELTMISNRRGFQTLAKFALDLCRRQAQSAWLLMVDLDHFKEINDNFGHAEGDFALTGFANIMTAVFRNSDVIGRLGGDEFAVLLTNTDGDQLELVYARLQSAVEAHNLRLARGYEIQYSVGAAQLNLGRIGSVADLLAEADAQMYAQKKLRHACRAEKLHIPARIPQGSDTPHQFAR